MYVNEIDPTFLLHKLFCGALGITHDVSQCLTNCSYDQFVQLDLLGEELFVISL